MDNEYKFKLSDWVPYKGIYEYTGRNTLEPETYTRTKVLLVYNFLTGGIIIWAGKKVLETILESRSKL